MFSWICPRCGRENRASDTECTSCKREDLQAESQKIQEVATLPAVEPWATEVAPAPPVSTRSVEVPQLREAPPARVPDPPAAEIPRFEARRPAAPAHAPASRSGMPTWLLIPLFALAFLGLGALLYFGYQRFGGGKAGFTGGEVPAAVLKVKTTNPLQKYVEVVGIRLTQDAKKKPQARFIAVNHGSAELNDLTANVTLWASTSRSEEDSVGTFTFKINSLGPNEAKEITTPLKTKLRVYELPDWQNMTAEVQLTSQ